MALFELKGVTKSFGGLRVVDALSLRSRGRRDRELIGPNGAGKTTVFNLVTGIYAPDEGEIRFDGADIAASRRTRSRAGSRAPSRRCGCS